MLRPTRQHSSNRRFNLCAWLGLALILAWVVLGALCPARPIIAQDPAQDASGQVVYIPYIQDGSSPATPVPTAANAARVYGLVGTLSQPGGKMYTYYLTTANNGYYALAGEDPETEAEIAALAASNAAPSVKVWGAVQPPEASSEPPLIVVTGILGTEATVPTPVAGMSVPIATVKYDLVNLYSGPGTTYSVVGQVVMRQSCEVTGRNANNTWLQLTCSDGQQGWVDARLVDVSGNLEEATVINVAAPTPTATAPVATATPSPTPATFTGWQTQIYNNSTLSGAPVAVVDIPTINFDWGNGGPSQVAPDNFSMRFNRTISVTPGTYQFTATADDGVRIWVDGRQIINAWPANPSQNYVATIVLTGIHQVVVEYYEQSGLARVQAGYGVVSASNYWQASYYNGTTPSGTPVLSQQEPAGANPLNYNWGSGAPPSTPLGGDNWSARWQGDFPFESGNFVFRTNVDDGVRLYIDGLLVLDYWIDGYKEVNNRVLGIGAGRHTIVVEYYERSGNASIVTWWYRDSAYVGPQ